MCRARVVFIVPFFSVSLLSCVVKVVSQLSLLPASLFASARACVRVHVCVSEYTSVCL